MCERYALVSSQDGVPARFFIFDTQDPLFLMHGECQTVDGGLSWLVLNKESPEKRTGLIVRTGATPQDLIASLGLSQFFIQFKDNSSMYAVHTYNKKTHTATIEFAGSALDINLNRELISAIWIKEPYTYFNGYSIDNMEKMTKLMIFKYTPSSSNNPLGYNVWSQAIDPWELNK